MRIFLSTLMISALALFLACQSASSSSSTDNSSDADATAANSDPAKNTADDHGDHAHNDDTPRISLADAKKDFDADNAVFIDTRSDASYDNEHIKGSVNIPAIDFPNKYKSLPKDKKLIAYCS